MNDEYYEFDDNRDSADECSNDGPVCYGCPLYDNCGNHADVE